MVEGTRDTQASRSPIPFQLKGMAGLWQLCGPINFGTIPAIMMQHACFTALKQGQHLCLLPVLEFHAIIQILLVIAVQTRVSAHSKS